MATLADLRARIRRPLERERAAGCRDDVVVGGIERLSEQLARPFPEVRAALAGYAHLPHEARERAVDEALALLTDPPPATAPRGESAADRPRPGPTRSAPTRSEPTRSAAPRPDPPRGASSPPAADADAFLERSLADAGALLGPQAPKKLAALGLVTIGDLLRHAPRRYEDRRALPTFAAAAEANLADKPRVTVQGAVVSRAFTPTRRGGVLRAVLQDGTGDRLTALWFNQPWLEGQIFPKQRLIVTGKLQRRGRALELMVENHEVDDDGPSLSTGRIVAVYPATQGLAQATLRRSIDRLLNALPPLPDPLPLRLRRDLGLIDADRAWREVHRPSSDEGLADALARLRFDEFLLLELRVLMQRDLAVGRGFPSLPDDEAAFAAALPYALTAAQTRALSEIRADLASPRQMARLLMGDVGSGKTAVAAGAAFTVHRAGVQTAVMAPTELLARQHHASLTSLLWPLGVRVDLLVGGMAGREREEARSRLRAGATDLIVGTHALIQEGVEFRDLGLAVIDEEHRFGVEQRRRLLRGAPDVLVMTATPIPRSLALTVYGDLDVSILDERPPGRSEIRTDLVPARERSAVYRALWAELAATGRQAFVVAPLVADSEAMEEILSATTLHDDLRAILPPDARLGLLHGRLPAVEKEGVMAAFRARDLDVLVATTVVEVGVDVPNATVIVIENAERFGLAQLHQLRGRVGRGQVPGRCVLIAGETSRATMARLRVVERHTDGFLIAERDLELRGPGELRGTRQSGIPDLTFGDLARDQAVIESARSVALRMLAASPTLDAPWAARIRAALQRRERAVGLRRTL